MDVGLDLSSESLILTGVGKLLLKGSLDLLIHIQLFLDPVDILALRSTCKHLWDATRSRTVWMNAVRNVSVAQGAFLPSFPLQEMSLDDLEHAALSPRRLWALIGKADVMKPFLIRVFTPRTSRGAEPVSIDGARLVPGGRFLLTSTNNGGLSLWDIGYNAGTHMKIFPIATLAGSSATSSSSVTNVGCTPDSSGLYIFMKSRLVNGHAQVSCYEIYPISEAPNFSQLGTLSARGPLKRTDISKDYFIGTTVQPSTLIIWRYTKRELGVSWDVDSVYDLWVLGDTVITFHEYHFSLWTIPELQPLADGYAPVITQESKWVFAYAVEQEGGPSLGLPNSWVPEHARNQFGIYHDETPAMALYRVKSIYANQDPDLPDILPVRSGSMQLSNSLGLGASYLSPLHVTGDGFLQTWKTSNHISVDIMTKPSPANPTYSSATSNIWKDPRNIEGLEFGYEFCPVTGRLIVHVKGSDTGGDNEVRIMDFIPPRSFS